MPGRVRAGSQSGSTHREDRVKQPESKRSRLAPQCKGASRPFHRSRDVGSAGRRLQKRREHRQRRPLQRDRMNEICHYRHLAYDRAYFCRTLDSIC